MNQKATVSKELNDKQMKVLEGLLKLPENKECADCKSKAPRWASINLGIFICLHCSGIHRSLGVHISKVRSATLDTWLPEQVAFMQSMGNEKSNAHWEAELPQQYDRSQYDNFIRAKYVQRKWIPRNDKVQSPPRFKEELASPRSSRSGSSSTIAEFANDQSTGRTDCSINGKQEASSSGRSSPGSSEVYKYGAEKDNHLQNPKDGNYPQSTDFNADQKSVICRSPKEPAQVVPDPGPNKVAHNTESAVSTVQSSSVNAPPVVPSSKVDYATELFRMLCTGDLTGSDSSPSSDMSGWVDFETDEDETSEITREKIVQKSSASNICPEPKKDDVLTSLVPATKGHPKKHLKDAANENQSSLKEPNVVLASSINLGKLVMPAQGSLPNPTRMSNYGSQNYPDSVHQQRVNISEQQPLTGARSVKHAAGSQMPMLNVQPAKFTPIAAPYTSMYRQAVPWNGVSATPVKKPPSALPVSGYDYDFSFLTQGMFTKR